MKTTLSVVMTLSLALLSQSASAITWYVDQANGDDLDDGQTPTTAFATMTQALSVFADGDDIQVGAGVYGPSSGEIFPLSYLGTRMEIQGAGPGLTIFDGEGVAQVMSLQSPETIELFLSSVAIVDGASAIGAGISIGEPSVVEVTNVRFEGNDGNIGGAFHAQINRDADAVMGFTDTVFINNEAAIGPGLHVQQNGSGIHDVTVHRSEFTGHNRPAITVSQNGGGSVMLVRSSIIDASRGDAISTRMGELTIENCTIVGTRPVIQMDGALTVVNSILVATSATNVIQGSGGQIRDSILIPLSIDDHTAGPNLIDDDPLLTPTYRLTKNSPARDRGDDSTVRITESDIDGEDRVIGTMTAGGALGLVDLGADEFDPRPVFRDGMEEPE
ncbi:MAG: DUF1565 domain-containing protein [Lysobacterales bacterium]